MKVILILKRKVIFSFILLIPLTNIAQNFDYQLENMAIELAEKINSHSKTKIALWGFYPDGDEKNILGDFLTEDFAIYLANHAETFAVVDRMHLKVLLKEHRLQSDGYIDEKTTKQLGKFIAADAVVVGTYSVLKSEIKIRLKVLDTENALQIGGVIKTLQMTDNIARLLGKL